VDVLLAVVLRANASLPLPHSLARRIQRRIYEAAEVGEGAVPEGEAADDILAEHWEVLLLLRRRTPLPQRDSHERVLAMIEIRQSK